MPELPEVETVRQGLIPVMEGKVVVRLDQRRPDLRWPLPTDLPKRLENSQILNITRRSKYLLFNLNTSETLIVHLGMSGRLLVLGNHGDKASAFGRFNFKTYKYDKHDHIIIYLNSGLRIVYNDPRRFGAMDLIATSKINSHSWLKNLGPEPLSNKFSSDHLYNRLSRRKSTIKAALMDQGLVSGLGNIYALEVLWLSGISPFRRANQISKREVESLTTSIRSILVAAIKAGGTSLKDFRQVGGEIGYFQQSLFVYGCFEQKCKNINCLGRILRVKQSGRTSYYCDSCQK